MVFYFHGHVWTWNADLTGKLCMDWQRDFSREKILKVCFIVLSDWDMPALWAFGYVLPKNVILLNAIGFVIFFFQGLDESGNRCYDQ